jgi:SAM-dependent methyltransferase
VSTDNPSTVRTSIDLELEPAAAFDAIVDELETALDRQGIQFEKGPRGCVTQGATEVGRVVSWKSGERILLEWRQAHWQPDEVTEVELRVERVDGRTRVTVEHRGWGTLVGDSSDLVGWFTSEIAAPFLGAMAPEALGNWITDRRARRPSGANARAVYRDPLFHYPNFRVILSELALTPDDVLLEVACGGGAMLKAALASGCRAAAVDHSPEMVRLARAENQEAVDAGRLEVIEASADQLPFADAMFTCATMTGVFGFLPDPVAALAEMRRCLKKGGRVVVQGTDPEMRGTPAAPEPIASRLHFYDEDELANLAHEAGFGSVRVVRRELEAFAREAGIPEFALPLFAGPGGRFLLAHKE